MVIFSHLSLYHMFIPVELFPLLALQGRVVCQIMTFVCSKYIVDPTVSLSTGFVIKEED